MPTDREVVESAAPFIRSLAAFLLYLRDPTRFSVDDAYKMADRFLAQLKKDL